MDDYDSDAEHERLLAEKRKQIGELNALHSAVSKESEATRLLQEKRERRAKTLADLDAQLDSANSDSSGKKVEDGKEPRDGKKRLVDPDGRVFRVYDKKSCAIAMEVSLYARRITDVARLEVFGSERVHLNPGLWANILSQKSSVDLFQFNYGSRAGWATAAIYHSVLPLPAMSPEGFSTFLRGRCNCLQWFLPTGSSRPSTLVQIAEALKFYEWMLLVTHSAAFQGIAVFVTTQFESSHLLTFCNKNHLVFYLESCIQEFNRIISSSHYEPVDGSWPSSLHTVDDCVCVWKLLFSDINLRLTQIHREVFAEQLASAEVHLFSMERDLLLDQSLTGVSPVKSPGAKRGGPVDDSDGGDLELKKQCESLERQLEQLRDRPNSFATNDPPSKSGKLCGQHLLSLAELGDPCWITPCKFLQNVEDVLQGRWSLNQDHGTINTLYERIQLAVAERTADY